MKYIDYDFIPFKINKSYKKSFEEIDTSITYKLFNKYDVTVRLFRNWFGKVCVDFVFTNEDFLNEIDNLLTERFNKPLYISGNGSKVWVDNKIYISHGVEETRFQGCEHRLEISQIKPPFIAKIDRYEKVFNIFNKLKYNFNFKETSNAFVGMLGEIHFLSKTQDYEYLIAVKKNQINMYSSEIKVMHDGIHSIPFYHVTSRIKKNTDMYSIINSFFLYMMEYDKNLKVERKIKANVKFLSDRRKTLPIKGYRPHIKVDGDETQYGIEFTILDVKAFDETTISEFKFLFDSVDYSSLTVGSKFSVNEGNKQVGEGIITEIDITHYTRR